MDKFREQMTEETKFGEHKIVLTSGGVDMPEPIGLKLIPIFEALKSHFYVVSDARSLSACKHTASLLMARRNNLEKILKDYPKLKNTRTPVGKYETKYHASHFGRVNIAISWFIKTGS